jgi:hypothetical protein
VFTKENQQIPNIKRKKKKEKKKKKKEIRSDQDQDRDLRSDQDRDRDLQIRSRFDPLDRDRCRDARRAFAVASVRR